MDKKKLIKTLPPEEMKGFEEFIEGQAEDSSFLPKPTGTGTKKETSFEHFTFLTTDADRLVRIKNLLMEKLPFTAKFEQSSALLKQQREEIKKYKLRLFEICEEPNSPYRKTLKETFDSYFEPPRTN
jgi:hypothetical protein